MCFLPWRNIAISGFRAELGFMKEFVGSWGVESGGGGGGSIVILKQSMQPSFCSVGPLCKTLLYSPLIMKA